MRANLADAEVARRRATILAPIAAFEVVEVDSVVLDRAAQPMPTELGTLDAIHLATALLWKELTKADLVMATHDGGLGLGARAHGLPVLGVSLMALIGFLTRCLTRWLQFTGMQGEILANLKLHAVDFGDAGSGNSDRVLSGNSGRSRQALRSRSTRAKRQPSASPGRGRSDRSHDPA